MVDKEKRECPVCHGMFDRNEMTFSLDCHGIPFRLLCCQCWYKIEDDRGFDGQYYTSADECIDEDY